MAMGSDGVKYPASYPTFLLREAVEMVEMMAEFNEVGTDEWVWLQQARGLLSELEQERNREIARPEIGQYSDVEEAVAAPEWENYGLCAESDPIPCSDYATIGTEADMIAAMSQIMSRSSEPYPDVNITNGEKQEQMLSEHDLCRKYRLTVASDEGAKQEQMLPEHDSCPKYRFTVTSDEGSATEFVAVRTEKFGYIPVNFVASPEHESGQDSIDDVLFGQVRSSVPKLG